MKRWHIVGISGVTCAGKTSLTKRLQDAIPDTIIFNQDQYFLSPDDERHLMIEELNHANWEIPSALNMDGLYEDVVACKSRELQSNVGLIIVEGILVLNYKPIADLCDLKFYLTLTKDQTWDRRQLRCYDPADPPGYFEKCVWPMHLKHYEELKLTTDITFIDGSLPKDTIFQTVHNAIRLSMEMHDKIAAEN